MRIITTQTADGDFHLVVDDQDIAYASGFGDAVDVATRLPSRLQPASFEIVKTHRYQTLIRDYFAGDGAALNKIPRQLIGSDFQLAVWRIISAIQYGSTLTYRQLANKSGRPTAVRAAGTACGRNRLVLLVPCHRILKSDGSSGNYLYGPKIKESLLLREASASQPASRA